MNIGENVKNLGHWRVLLGFVMVVLQGCGQPSASTEEEKRAEIANLYGGYRHSFPAVASIRVDQLQELQKNNPRVVLVDVREPKEQAVSMLPGAIALHTFERDIDTYRGATVVTYCTIGYRSGLFAQTLQQQGWRVFNLEGSILAWTHNGGKLVNEKGLTREVHVYGRRWNLVAPGYEAVW